MWRRNRCPIATVAFRPTRARSRGVPREEVSIDGMCGVY
ncbi:mycofactocin precursor [Rhodococcus hoagii]|nr:mycofactocin precursor [Prescottella equi]